MRKQGLHLPDCQRVQTSFEDACDCGQPRHPLPITQKLVRDRKGRIRVVSRNAKGRNIVRKVLK